MFDVVINSEQQYSIWPAHKELPKGWEKAGIHGTETECLAYIKENWVDMRPLSLRQILDS